MMSKKYVVMGVSGCGKSSIGAALGKALNIPFYDGDDFHPEENVQKMQSGQPLTDTDRQSWLKMLNELLSGPEALVVACSALKPEYRDLLRKGGQDIHFIYLKGDFDTIWSRHQKREGHYFNGSAMLESQFDILVEPNEQEALYVDIRQSPQQIVQYTLANLA
ncbi:gluconate kinase [Vibrio albus]|uniref:Gluconokinase n=1 Tax=Vibrio albus TaxID=2200953 RepID=A0A2U3B927_9VIBR|nr:gluconokinase [Vibrio albus]PWI33288.1 gluconate kinase [Vibrio albus]